ncbi:hypothetical protein OAF00_00870 [bacterium]|nr:hypothetical protein [bacterium]MDB4668817.1 hypothetical protein [bacterium]MDB4681104.1 hypothetical protein [bacterium]MDB4789832.1 hypothetical protein [bacterium]MDC0309481.1 hypothetical protein [bacterium]
MKQLLITTIAAVRLWGVESHQCAKLPITETSQPSNSISLQVRTLI